MSASRRRSVACLAGAVLALIIPALTLAHPLGNFTINHYAGIRVSQHAVLVDLVIDMAEIPALDAIAALDRDGDGVAAADELSAARAAACHDLVAAVRLTADERPVGLELAAAGMQVNPGAAGLSTLRTVCELRGALPAATSVQTTLSFADNSYPERIGWREIVVRGDGVRIDRSDSRGAVGAAGDVSERLTDYPTELLQRPLAEQSLTVRVLSGGAPLPAWTAPDATPLGEMPSDDVAGAGASVANGATPGGVASELAGLVDLRNLSLPVALLGLLLAAIAGAAHALSPGHGKTVMAAYLVGARGGPRDAVILGVAVTASHTIGVVALAGVVLLAGEVMPPERIYPVLTVVSGITVAIIGAWLLAGCIRRALSAAPSGHDHAHPHRHDGEEGHAHPHPHSRSSEMPLPGWRGLAFLGIAGGLVPSTAALVLLLGAVAAGQPAYGLALALSFGAGMAIVLSGIGLALVHGRRLIAGVDRRFPSIERLRGAVPWVSAVVVLAGGIVLAGTSLATTL